MSFQSKMIKLRKIKGYTQDTFAKAVGVSRQSVYKWESSLSTPEIDKLLVIARLFEVTVDSMLDDAMDVDRKGVMRPAEEVRAEEELLAQKKEQRRLRYMETRARNLAALAEGAPAEDAPAEDVAEEVAEEAAEAVAEEAAEAVTEVATEATEIMKNDFMNVFTEYYEEEDFENEVGRGDEWEFYETEAWLNTNSDTDYDWRIVEVE